MKKLNKLGQEGFTLIEILMAVLIIVILAVVGITQFNNFAADAKDAATKSNLAILRNAIGVMNSMERVRCGKTNLVFPDPITVQTNDITACAATNTNAACYFSNIINPATGTDFTACSLVTVGADTAYNAKFPGIDRPYVQNAIPNNPWTSPKETLAGAIANFVSADVVSATNANVCKNAPTYIGGGTTVSANATECSTATVVFDVADAGAAAPTSYVLSTGTEPLGGWCYCGLTGQIWANTANNDGLSTGTGIESQF